MYIVYTKTRWKLGWKIFLVFKIFSFEVQNESTNVSISQLIIGTKPKPFDLIRLLSEQKQNVSICSKII